jgi:hypothetical protein
MCPAFLRSARQGFETSDDLLSLCNRSNANVRTSRSGQAEPSETADFPPLMIFANPRPDFCKCEPDPEVRSTEPEQVPTPH